MQDRQLKKVEEVIYCAEAGVPESKRSGEMRWLVDWPAPAAEAYNWNKVAHVLRSKEHRIRQGSQK
jgi:uncharacterized lipoprotein